MPISSVNSGFAANQSMHNNVLPQRPEEVHATGDSHATAPEKPVKAVAGLGAPIPLFNLVGVAAYKAIMNPELATSMRIEA
jgi:hypothetical protein